MSALKKVEIDVADIRSQFPLLTHDVNGHPLVYLDNAATTQKPAKVIEAIQHYYEFDNSNVHRGAHFLSDRATEKFEQARHTVANFINSPSSKQVIWTRGTTESINLVASTWGSENINEGDKILVSKMDHHSNIVPWQMLAQSTGAELVPVNVFENGELDTQHFGELLDASVKLVAICHISNALGTINPIEQIICDAHQVGAKVLIDGAQSIAHMPIDVQQLDCDFFAFSGHKMFGPTGIGVLWGKEELLDAMPPYHGGGEMIEKVSFTGTTYNGLPYKFEAGTPDISGAIGLAAAVEFINQFDRQLLADHENQLLRYALEKARQLPYVKLIGEAKHRSSVMSFLLEGCHPSDVGMLLDQQGIAVRTGHHCTQPLMEHFDIPGTIRASFSIYNTIEDVNTLFRGIAKAKEFFG